MQPFDPSSQQLPPMIRKRNGQIVPFQPEKIALAIAKAFKATGHGETAVPALLAAQITETLDLPKRIPTVEEIQDKVEKALFENGYFEVLRSYIVYREQHAAIRRTQDLFSGTELVESYLQLEDWRVRESANSSYSLQGLHQHVSTIISSHYWLEKLYSPEVGKAHREGKFHVHDLGFLSVYCVGWDLQDLLLTGFGGVEGKVSCKPPKHLRSALGQVVNFFYTMQGEAAGAQAFSNFDTYLAPFIRYDGLTRQQLKQDLQEFLFNINVPTRVGFQTPFTNITLDLKVPKFLQDQLVIVGGEFKDAIYAEFQPEMDLFNDVFAELMLEGDANGRVFSFPIPTYNITADFEWDNPSYRNIWEMTAKYGVPYFSNFVNSDLDPDDVRSMCCRLRLDKRALQKRGGGLFGANPLTGSIGVVTINLPRLGYEAKGEEDFFEKLSKLMDLAKNSLETKRKVIETLTEKGLFPYTKFYLRHLKQRDKAYWNNHFSTIGLVGMNECCLNFLGEELVSKRGHEFAQQILDFMRDRLQTYQSETGHIYNLEATPAEGTSYRLAKIDKSTYAGIIVANEEAYKRGAAPYYTNSSQLPVYHTDDLLEALRLQDDLQTKYTGGTVFHTFIGEKRIPAEMIKNLVFKITHQFRLPYVTISPTFSICPEHGYQYGEHRSCPACQKEGKQTACEVFARIVGYLRPVSHWNDGKQAEFVERKLFTDLPTNILHLHP